MHNSVCYTRHSLPFELYKKRAHKVLITGLVIDGLEEWGELLDQPRHYTIWFFLLATYKNLGVLQENLGCNPPSAESHPVCTVRYSINAFWKVDFCFYLSRENSEAHIKFYLKLSVKQLNKLNNSLKQMARLGLASPLLHLITYLPF